MGKDRKEDIVKRFAGEAITYSKFQSLIAFASAGSVAAAANNLHRDSSSISRDIGDLEKALGCKLRQNKGRTAKPSPAGEELVILARRQMEELNHFRNKHLNSVSVAGGDSLLHLILLPKIWKVQQKYHDARISISSLRTFEIIQSLQSFSLDLGLVRKESLARKTRVHERENESLEYEEVGEYRYAVFIPKSVCSKSDIHVDTEIPDLRFAMIRNHWDIDFIELAKAGGIVFNDIRVICDNFTQIFGLVRLGQFAGILPIFCRRLMAQDTICYEPQFLKKEKHQVVLAWNPAMLKIKTGLRDFIDSAVGELRAGFQIG